MMGIASPADGGLKPGRRGWRGVVMALAAAAVSACGSSPPRDASLGAGAGPSAQTAGSGLSCVIPSPTLRHGGAYYLDDGPGSSPPANLSEVPDAVPRLEPLRAANMKPYVALGKRYTPMTELGAYRERGLASWYGRRYHGQKTASGEVYDMYAMTAAHPTLPIPSYARVTNVKSGRSVVVRVNDRGPFHSDRVIDLSFTAACKLELLGGGSGLVEVETIVPGETPTAYLAEAAKPPPPARLGDSPAPKVVAISSAAEQNGVPLPAASPAEREDLLAALARGDDPLPPGIYLQLGAFGARENADGFLAHLRAELTWLEDRISLFHGDGLYRVQAGPYASAADARVSAERIARAMGFKPLLTSR